MASITFSNTLLLLGAMLVLVGVFSSLVASRFGAPLLLVFLFVGMLAGQDGPLGLEFDDYQLTYLIGSLALAVILFDGGLRTRLASSRGALAPAALLSTAGVVVTATVTAMAAWLVLPLTWVEALLIGAIVGSTDAAAVFFLLRAGGMQLKPRVNATLEIESGTNDPVAVFLTLMLVELLLSADGVLGWSVLGTLLQQAAIGAFLGVAGGLLGARLLNRLELPSGLHPLLVVSGAVFVFAVAAVLGGSGFLAVYLAGLVMGNRPVRAIPGVITFHDTATWLAQIVMFMVLGLLVTPSELVRHLLPALAIAAALIFIARPAAVFACLAPFGYSRREKVFVSWVGLRGAVSIFLAAIPVLSGVVQAELFFNIAFFMVLISLLLQGWTIRTAARRLGMTLPRRSAPVHRVELDLPGQLDYELVGYHVLAGSPVLAGRRLPAWVRRVLVIRNQEILEPAAAGELCEDDYAYFLAPPGRVERLDQAFAVQADGPATSDSVSYPGHASVAEVADTWHLEVPVGERGRTLAEFVEAQLGRPPRLGDRVIVERTWWVVADEIDGHARRLEIYFRDPDQTLAGRVLTHPGLGRVLRAARRWMDGDRHR